MTVLNSLSDNIGSLLAKKSRETFRLGFENSFRQIQSTAINRINSEIDVIDKKYDLTKRFEDIQRQTAKLERDKELIDRFAFENKSNELRLSASVETAATAIAAFSSEDDDTNLTATELASVQEQQTTLASQVEKLLLTIHPDYVQPFIISSIKNDLTELKAFTPVEGTIDASGAPATNDNRAMLDFMSTLRDKMQTGILVSQTTGEDAVQASLNITTSLLNLTADQSNLSLVQLEKREAEIADVKSKYANILRVISISFEARADTLDRMGKAFDGPEIGPGSIMNIFV